MKAKNRILVSTIGLAALTLMLVVALLPSPPGSRPAFADPFPPPTPGLVLPRVFCFRITDIRSDPLDTDRFTFEFEVLNWTNISTDGMRLALAAPNAGNVSITGAGIDANGRPLVVEDVNGDTITTDPPDSSDLEDIDGDGILDALEDNGVVDGGFSDNANGRLDNDPIPGNLNPANDWSVASQTALSVTWTGGTPVPSKDLLGAGSTAAANALIPGFPGTTAIDGAGTVSPAEAIDNDINVLDGFTLTVDNFDAGDTFQLNWFLLSGGSEIGTMTGGNGYGFGVLNIARVDGGPLPGPVYAGNTGFTQDTRDFFDSVYIVPPNAQFALEFGAAFTASTFIPPGVGGILERPDPAELPLEAPEASRPNVSVVASISGGLAMGAVALGGAAWYARRRRLR